MYYTEDQVKFFEKYEELKKKNPNISLKDCMSTEMISDLESDKYNVIKTSKEDYNYKKFNYDTLIENKDIYELAEYEYEFRYPNYILDYDFEFAEPNFKTAVINYLNQKLISFVGNKNFDKIMTEKELLLDDTLIVVYKDHTEVIIKDYFYFSVRLIIKENEVCLLGY